MHLLIPFACSQAPACESALGSLRLPHLEKLLRRLVLVDTDAGSSSSLSAPHERALARACAMQAPDGCIAWAAHEAALAGRDPGRRPWAWITPVHWDVGADTIVMADPRALDLPEAESRELLGAMRPFFAEDGVALEYAAAGRWLARGEIFDQLPSASLDRVSGRDISAWMPSAPGLRRLQNEMQMLLYTHPVNDARSARGRSTVNSFWISGTGKLPSTTTALRPAPFDPAQARPSPNGGVVVVDTLRNPAVRNDWALWGQGWAHLDQHECLRLLQSLGSDEAAQLTLCGERNALTFGPARGGLLKRLRRRITPTTLKDLQHQL